LHFFHEHQRQQHQGMTGSGSEQVIVEMAQIGLNGCQSCFDGLQDWIAWSWNWRAGRGLGVAGRETVNQKPQMSTKLPRCQRKKENGLENGLANRWFRKKITKNTLNMNRHIWTRQVSNHSAPVWPCPRCITVSTTTLVKGGGNLMAYSKYKMAIGIIAGLLLAAKHYLGLSKRSKPALPLRSSPSAYERGGAVYLNNRMKKHTLAT
jgi:hypothetical protein